MTAITYEIMPFSFRANGEGFFLSPTPKQRIWNRTQKLKNLKTQKTYI
jgi:hypothetical protein